MEDLVNIAVGTAGTTAILGYAVVFFALVLLMAVVLIMGSVMKNRQKQAAVESPAPAPVAAPPAVLAPGSAGELKLYDTDPRVAATLMAIVADEMKAPINELRFLSIREIKEDK